MRLVVLLLHKHKALVELQGGGAQRAVEGRCEVRCASMEGVAAPARPPHMVRGREPPDADDGPPVAGFCEGDAAGLHVRRRSPCGRGAAFLHAEQRGVGRDESCHRAGVARTRATHVVLGGLSGRRALPLAGVGGCVCSRHIKERDLRRGGRWSAQAGPVLQCRGTHLTCPVTRPTTSTDAFVGFQCMQVTSAGASRTICHGSGERNPSVRHGRGPPFHCPLSPGWRTRRA